MNNNHQEDRLQGDNNAFSEEYSQPEIFPSKTLKNSLELPTCSLLYEEPYWCMQLIDHHRTNVQIDPAAMNNLTQAMNTLKTSLRSRI